MSSQKSFRITYNGQDLYPINDQEHGLLFNGNDLQKGLDVTESELSDIFAEHTDHFKAGKHYIFDAQNEQLWTKQGIVKLAFFIGSNDAFSFIDLLEETVVPKIEEVNTDNIIKIYKSVEEKFVSFADEIAARDDVDLDELKKFIETFNMFVHTQRQLIPEAQPPIPATLLTSPPSGTKKSGIMNAIYNIAGKTGGDAMKFASDTRDAAQQFASQTESDAFTFTQDTRDTAYNFASKTEDDAFKFATKMEDDAYNFVTKMADDAYHFASKGMDYGYMFTTQGEELGPMADRILWMASEIGLMADRIGEMSDRIVHTEHLIINMSINILNFGLLIDGTMKTISEAGLNALGMIFDKEVPKLQSTDKHIELISQNIQTILQHQHEYDMKVLENQKVLRETTISALDKISNEY